MSLRLKRSAITDVMRRTRATGTSRGRLRISAITSRAAMAVPSALAEVRSGAGLRPRAARRVIAYAPMKATLLLTDYAKVSDGKLDVLGGGWSVTGPGPFGFVVAAMIQISWDQTNMPHAVRLELLDADGE